MKVDPCRYDGSSDLCCEQSNEAVCEDNTDLFEWYKPSLSDQQIANSLRGDRYL
eukprot:CAMPEP_0202977044 /NCGR_PEP_ID=MMETSP1396-20130829/82782_1 /ASSEMBLY_ACC=CAM_ASM_000872 /TAXON_ID= /ORGANISM="Pseudokeronopsis sp., Strain Brazil" /LENGTH=53 /DNA_ID=CAMNT_0049715483 /DNA_START=84 /DNA_END=241 /DNA_ORIENTATION=+